MSNKTFFVELTLTNACNCACDYCFEGSHTCCDRNIDEEKRQLALILRSIEAFDKDKYDKFVISFWGGEPFMNTEFMFDIINATCSYDFVHYNYYSNGTLVYKYEEFLKQDFINSIKSRLRIQLSYDGYPIHNIKRKNDARNIFTVADLLRTNGIQFDFKATLTYDTLQHIPTVWDSYYAVYLRYGDNVSYSPTLDTNCTADVLTDDNIKLFEENILELCKREYLFKKKYGRFLSGILDGNKRNCNINDSIFMHTDGNIYYCHGCPYKKDNANMILCSTKDINTLYDVKKRKVDVNLLIEDCQNCVATHCSVCHIMNIAPNLDPIDNWISCRANNKRCKYYKVFGKFNRLLNYALSY